MDYYGDKVIIHIICLYFIFVKQNHHFLVVMEVAAMTPLITIQVLGLTMRGKQYPNPGGVYGAGGEKI